jgi:hypothetical protein
MPANAVDIHHRSWLKPRAERALAERSSSFFSGPFTADETARLEGAIETRLARERHPPSAASAFTPALPPAPTFDEAELDAARRLAYYPAPAFNATRGAGAARWLKQMVNLVLRPLGLPQRRFNAAVAARLVAVEETLRELVGFTRALREEVSRQRAAIDRLLRDPSERPDAPAGDRPPTSR